MTDNTQELDKILINHEFQIIAMGDDDIGQSQRAETRAAIIDWHNKQIAKARMEELQDIDVQRDHNMSYLGGRMSETNADNLATSRIKDRIAELSQTLKELKEAEL